MPNTSLAEYFGVRAPELPKFIVANTFLASFFKQNKSDELNYEALKEFIICEEANQETRQMLFNSFDKYLNEYLGNNLLKKSKTTNIFLPVTKNMIFGYTPTLRNLLYHLLASLPNFKIDKFCRELSEFLWNDSSEVQGNAFILSKLLSKKTFKEGKAQTAKEAAFGEQKSKEYFRILGEKLYSDLSLMFESKYFNSLDFYKKYDYFSTLLTLYVTIFSACRGNLGKKPEFLCKGSSQSSLNYGDFHKSCVTTFNRIRNGYSVLLIDYYKSQFNTEGSSAIYINIFIEQEEIKIKLGEKTIKTFAEFVDDDIYDLSSGSPGQIKIKKKKIKELKEYLGLDKGGIKMTKEEFAFKYSEFHKSKRGNNMIKITSVFSSSGAAIGLVHPKKAGKAKYFALSGEISEFFVRMYIASINKDNYTEKMIYGNLNDFILWLKNNYYLHIEDNSDLREFLRTDNISIKSSDYSANKRYLIGNLTSIDCLIKLSDSAYIVTIPEAKGDFKGI